MSQDQESVVSSPTSGAVLSEKANSTRDTCRELETTPVEAHAAYVELNGQITIRLGVYVDSADKAQTDFETLLPLLNEMHSLLSQRGLKRKLMMTLALPTWSEWFEDFRKRLHEDRNIRTVQRRLREYRNRDGETAPPKDANVLAKESIRLLESKRHAERLDVAVEDHNQLNPAIRADLIRALEAQAQRLMALAEKLKQGFVPLPVAETGKAHQRLVREHRATLPDPLLEEKRKAAADFKNASVREIPYDVAKNVVLANEYLGTMPGGVTNCFGLYFEEHLGSVVVFGSTAGNKVAASVCGPEHKNKVTVLVRGATQSWADPPRTSADGRTHTGSAASFLIARACDMMAAKGKPIIVAYSDPAGGELGTIYQSCNFLYTGMGGGSEVFISPDGKRHNTRQIHGQTRDRRNGGLKYKRSRAEQRRLLVEQGCTFEKENGKHRYVHFAGDRRTRLPLRNALKWEVQPHPRRQALAVAAPTTTAQIFGNTNDSGHDDLSPGI